MTPDRLRMREYIHDSTHSRLWSDEERMRVREDLNRMYHRHLDGKSPLDETLMARAKDAAHAERVSSAMQDIERYALRDLDPHTASTVDEAQQRYEMTQQSRAAWNGGERMASRDADAFQDYERNRLGAAAERASAYVDERRCEPESRVRFVAGAERPVEHDVPDGARRASMGGHNEACFSRDSGPQAYRRRMVKRAGNRSKWAQHAARAALAFGRSLLGRPRIASRDGASAQSEREARRWIPRAERPKPRSTPRP